MTIASRGQTNSRWKRNSARSMLKSSWSARHNTVDHLEWVYKDSIRRREEMRQAEIKRKLEAETADRERLIKLEADRLKRLTDNSENYQRAQTIRALVSTVIAIQAESINPDRITRWQEWALMQADKLDPIATGRIWDDINDNT
ncbi:hypothetical protein [Bradyrhizobium australiense]|uniref:Uncharacterized protein n=1 Tax=Bradyrhizobium australiense TaxID=2721161 RepID=A0A7Y4LUU6_9BRAD|nr:hypothetical protein [Bradyrhizobium australiense]NOJ39060.1 hypothetical protein [Bradyrhizobium australiense]